MTEKVAVITGSGDGLGKAIAQRLGNDGFRIVLSDINADTLKKTEAEFKAAGVPVTAFQGNVSRRDDQFLLVKHAVDTFGQVDVFVNNAGVEDVMPLDRVTEADFDRVFNINVKGVLWGIQAAAEQMKKQGGDRICKIINAASIAAHESYDLLGIYCASKFSVRALTDLAARNDSPALSRLCQTLSTAIGRGSPLAAVLHDQARDIREASRQRLMEEGGKREIAMLFPVVFLILPVTVLFALYPGLMALDITP